MEYFSRFMATLMVIILSPLFLLISCLSLVFQGNPVLFKQERIGFTYNPFMLVKFRSMIKNNGNNKITNILFYSYNTNQLKNYYITLIKND